MPEHERPGAGACGRGAVAASTREPSVNRPRWVVVSGVVAITTFVLVVWQVVAGGVLLADDLVVGAEVREHRYPWLVDVAAGVTAFGAAVVQGVLLVAVGVVVAWRVRGAGPLLVAGGAGLALGVAAGGAKLLIGRARPPVLDALHSGGTSFPSGHTTSTTVAFGIGYLLLTGLLSQRWRRPLAGAAIVVPVLVGLSRLYLDLHWFSDVLAGWALGTVIVMASAVAYHTPQMRQFRLPMFKSSRRNPDYRPGRQ